MMFFYVSECESEAWKYVLEKKDAGEKIIDEQNKI